MPTEVKNICSKYLIHSDCKESTCNAADASSIPGVRKIPWRRDRLPTPVFLAFPGGSDGKKFPCNVGDLGSIPGLGRSPGGEHGNLLQYPCLENPMDRGAWWAAVHGVAKSRTRLNTFTFNKFPSQLVYIHNQRIIQLFQVDILFAT